MYACCNLLTFADVLNIEIVLELCCYFNIQFKNMLRIASSVTLHSGDGLYGKLKHEYEVFK